MIIRCEQCNTKFKLDDSKVKPEGIKVKCKKCGNIFFVFPQTIEQQEPIFSDESVKTQDKDVSVNVGIFETNTISDIEKDKKITESKDETSSLIDWGNISFDNTSKPIEISSPSEEEKPFEDFIKGINEMESEKNIFQGDSEVISFPEEERKDVQLIKEEDLENSLKLENFFEKEERQELVIKETKEIEEKTEQHEFITPEDIEDLDKETKKELSTEPEPQNFQEPLKDDDFIFESDENRVTEDHIENNEGIKTPEDFFKDDSDKNNEEVQASQQKQLPEDFLAEAPKKFNVLEFLIAILIVIVLGGGGLGYMWWQRVQVSEKIGHIGILNAKASFVDNKELEKVFVVTGKIKNGYNVPKSFLKVKCVLLDKNNKKIGEKTVFAGNTFTEAEIKELTYAEIEKGLNNKMGKSMVNVDVPPGKVVDFMVVIDKLPEDAVAVEVEGV